MCGRFILVSAYETIATHFGIQGPQIKWEPRYNIAPTQPCLTIISQHHQKKIVPMSWGLIPNWSKNPSTGFQFFNARAETLLEKPSFRDSFRLRRCLVPATGFFEWKKTKDNKIPYKIGLKDDSLFAFAGLWDAFTNEKGETILTFTIITTVANELTSSLHDRMPVILKREDEESWINEDILNEDILMNFLKPYPSEFMAMHEVSPLANSWKNDFPDILKYNI